MCIFFFFEFWDPCHKKIERWTSNSETKSLKNSNFESVICRMKVLLGMSTYHTFVMTGLLLRQTGALILSLLKGTMYLKILLIARWNLPVLENRYLSLKMDTCPWKRISVFKNGYLSLKMDTCPWKQTSVLQNSYMYLKTVTHTGWPKSASDLKMLSKNSLIY